MVACQSSTAFVCLIGMSCCVGSANQRAFEPEERGSGCAGERDRSAWPPRRWRPAPVFPDSRSFFSARHPSARPWTLTAPSIPPRLRINSIPFHAFEPSISVPLCQSLTNAPSCASRKHRSRARGEVTSRQDRAVVPVAASTTGAKRRPSLRTRREEWGAERTGSPVARNRRAARRLCLTRRDGEAEGVLLPALVRSRTPQAERAFALGRVRLVVFLRRLGRARVRPYRRRKTVREVPSEIAAVVDGRPAVPMEPRRLNAALSWMVDAIQEARRCIVNRVAG